MYEETSDDPISQQTIFRIVGRSGSFPASWEYGFIYQQIFDQEAAAGSVVFYAQGLYEKAIAGRAEAVATHFVPNGSDKRSTHNTSQHRHGEHGKQHDHTP